MRWECAMTQALRPQIFKPEKIFIKPAENFYHKRKKYFLQRKISRKEPHTDAAVYINEAEKPQPLRLTLCLHCDQLHLNS